MKNVDLSKNLYTVFVGMLMVGFTLMMLVTQDVRTIDFDFSKTILNYTIRIRGTVGKSTFIAIGALISAYSVYQMHAENKFRHSVIMTGMIMTLIAGIFVFTANGAIAGSTPGAFLVVLIVADLFSFGNALIYSGHPLPRRR